MIDLPALTGEPADTLVSRRDLDGIGPIPRRAFEHRAGASGFLIKRTPPEDLLEGLRVVASGDALLAPSVTRWLMNEFATATGGGPRPTDVRNRELDRLTDREREVLVLMAQGLANREIADELSVSESTVKTHVKRILMKLDLRDRVHAVVFAYETGLIEPGRLD